MARADRAQNPNLAQIARLSSAEISPSGKPAIPSGEASASALADLRRITRAGATRLGLDPA